jgi:hypothetical protein
MTIGNGSTHVRQVVIQVETFAGSWARRAPRRTPVQSPTRFMGSFRSSGIALFAVCAFACGSPPPPESPSPPAPPSFDTPRTSPEPVLADAPPEASSSSATPAPTAAAATDPDDPMTPLTKTSAPAPVPGISGGSTTIHGQLHPSRILPRLRERFVEFRRCHPHGAGTERVATRFDIGRDGKVSSVTDNGSTSPDGPAALCVRAIISKIDFQPPKRGFVTVTYPLTFGEP